MIATTSIRRIGGLLALAALVALPATAQTTPPLPAPSGDGAGCLPWLAKPMSTSGPLCGSCAGQCKSDGLCKGRMAGDQCDNSGGTCQIVGGCGLHDCCRCTNALFTTTSEKRTVASRPPVSASFSPSPPPS